MNSTDPEGRAAAEAMERLESTYARAHNIDDRHRVQSFVDSLSHDERLLAGPYLGDPLELTLIKMAIRLEQHIATTDHAGGNPWKAVGAAVVAAGAGAVATLAAIREGLK